MEKKMEENVFYFDSKLLDSFPKIKERLFTISRDCDGNNNAFNVFIACETCTTTIYMYVDMNEESKIILKFQSEELKVKYINDYINRYIIAGYLICAELKERDNYEIYDVCTAITYRRKGFSKVILNVVKKKPNFKKIWLGINPNNKMWDSVLNLYVKLGFSDPKLTTESLSGNKFNFYFISLILKEENKSVSKYNHKIPIILTEANALKNKYLGIYEDYVRHLHIPYDVFNFIHKNYMFCNREYAGSLIIQKYIRHPRHTPKNIKYGHLVYPVGTELIGPKGGPTPYKGININDFKVDLNTTSTFSFHTHPIVCYDYHNTELGWPSSPDMLNMLREFKHGIRKHYVFTREGIYGIQISPRFQQVINKYESDVDERCKNGIYEYLSRLFRKSEVERTKNYIIEKCKPNEFDISMSPLEQEVLEEKTKEIQNEYLSLMNNLTYAKFVNTIDVESDKPILELCRQKYEFNNDSCIFIINIIQWQDVEKDSGALDVLYIQPIEGLAFNYKVNANHERLLKRKGITNDMKTYSDSGKCKSDASPTINNNVLDSEWMVSPKNTNLVVGFDTRLN